MNVCGSDCGYCGACDDGRDNGPAFSFRRWLDYMQRKGYLMVKIRLMGLQGQHVGDAEIATPDKFAPDVVTWRQRTFVNDQSVVVGDVETYREVRPFGVLDMAIKEAPKTKG